MTKPTPTHVNEFSYASGHHPEPNGLDELLARYDWVKDEADKAEARLNELTRKIKAELTGGYARPDGTPYAAYHLASPDLAKPLHLRWTVSGRLNTKGLRETFPEIADRFTEQRGTWVLARDRK